MLNVDHGLEPVKPKNWSCLAAKINVPNLYHVGIGAHLFVTLVIAATKHYVRKKSNSTAHVNEGNKRWPAIKLKISQSNAMRNVPNLNKRRALKRRNKKRQEKLEEERLQKEEIEKFEKGGRRRNRRNRRNLSEIQEQGFLQKFKIPIFLFLTTFTSVMLAVYFYK